MCRSFRLLWAASILMMGLSLPGLERIGGRVGADTSFDTADSASGVIQGRAVGGMDGTVLPDGFDLGGVGNVEMLDMLSPLQRETFAELGFVVVPGADPQIYTVYQEAARRGWPVFVTTDAILHTYHVLYDYALRQVEHRFLVPALAQLVRAMLDASLEQMAIGSADVREAARRNVAFFGVALHLLEPDAVTPAEVEGQVRAELDLIAAHQGFAESPVFGVTEDYSQYVPRGHYNRNETFQRYFRAMMWLGRMPFLLRPGNTPQAVERGRLHTRQALLIVDALRRRTVEGEPALAVWERIYEPTAFFVGRTDDLDVHDYAQLMDEHFRGPADLQDLARLDRFIAEALELRPPGIISTWVTDQDDASRVTKGFRFMGQRFVFDSYIFQQLVYDQVGRFRGVGRPFTLVPSEVGPIRGFPRGLDVASVFGSERALDIMRAAGDADYEGYDEQMTKLRREVRHLPEEQWTENLYWGWLHSLRPLLEPKSEPHPAFMRTLAWVDKDLHTFLGSWAELRHDTILYAKQSMTIRATSAQPEPEAGRKGYVEPQPLVYSRLIDLVRRTHRGLQAHGVLPATVGRKLERMEGLLKVLQSASERELRGEPLTEQEYELIRGIGAELEALTTFTDMDEPELATETDERMAIVADVHTDTNTQEVLEEAVGDAFRIFVMVPVEGDDIVTVGSVFSYYEFKQPIDQRLTDEVWQALESRPPRPEWTARFIVE